MDSPAPADFHPELDQTDLLDEDNIWRHQSYIGILRWTAKLGRIELTHSAATMAKFNATRREGHLRALLWMFAYILQKVYDIYESL
jgi:hypothetical protein